MKDWILDGLEDNCITAIGICYRKDNYYGR